MPAADEIDETRSAMSWWRVVLIGPWTFVVAVLVMAGMAVWLPAGTGNVNNIIVPLVAFPAIWTILFLLAYLDRRTVRATCISILIASVHVAMIAAHVL